MERRIILSLFYVGLFSALLTIFMTGFTFYTSLNTQTKTVIEDRANVVATAYYNLDSYDELAEFSDDNLRITLISSEGDVLFESTADISQMDNHLDRVEIQKALKYGQGSDSRVSDTIGTKDYYYCLKLKDGNILRLSVTVNLLNGIYDNVLPILIFIIVIVLLLSVISSVFLTQRLLQPIRMIPDFLKDENINTSKIYPEIVPLITEIKNNRSEQELRRQEFTANVSHEMKTPLTSIMGYSQLIETGMATGDDAVRFAAKIDKEASRMLVLIKDIIRLSQLDYGENIDLNEDIDLCAIIDEIVDRLSGPAENKNIKLTYSGESEIIKGNHTQIYEMIYNLADNAIKYNRENGTVKITIENKKVSVEDTGIGIAEKDIGRIFERFYRADKSHSRATGGTGLGLSIVKHVAEINKAKVDVESVVNVGTKFTVTFQ